MVCGVLELIRCDRVRVFSPLRRRGVVHEAGQTDDEELIATELKEINGKL
jgi:hypothetical protein